MSQPRRDSIAPWVVGGVAAVVVAALLMVFFLILQPDRRHANPGKLSSGEKAAMSAAATEVANSLSFRQAQFAGDYARALAGSTGSFRQQLASNKTSLQQTLNENKIDLSATVTNTSIVGPVKGGYQVLVVAVGKSTAAEAVPIPNTVRVTIVRSGKDWLVSDVTSVGLS